MSLTKGHTDQQKKSRPGTSISENMTVQIKNLIKKKNSNEKVYIIIKNRSFQYILLGYIKSLMLTKATFIWSKYIKNHNIEKYYYNFK